MRYDELIEEGDWQGLLALLGSVVDVSATARAFWAFQRPRRVRSVAALPRLALVHAAGLRLRQTVAWAAGIGAASLAAPSLHGRLVKCGPWLEPGGCSIRASLWRRAAGPAAGCG